MQPVHDIRPFLIYNALPNKERKREPLCLSRDKGFPAEQDTDGSGKRLIGPALVTCPASASPLSYSALADLPGQARGGPSNRE